MSPTPAAGGRTGGLSHASGELRTACHPPPTEGAVEVFTEHGAGRGILLMTSGWTFQSSGQCCKLTALEISRPRPLLVAAQPAYTLCGRSARGGCGGGTSPAPGLAWRRAPLPVDSATPRDDSREARDGEVAVQAARDELLRRDLELAG
eukprot:CAMPEP_0196687230 /NCGR_PEP_ID=MMETSP1090-20130531/14265_1 /TAXON_ID=37098 /ORGANISM="Isochrysis sp, Strain CCMP1244" /LENGTH=148 /DNA_ID=CAMNT_0042026007 /DNA_START=35 /DNA_END=479 /DNA_ORIENTATION=+